MLNIPFDLQIEIIKKVSGVKSLLRFRSVSKPWKSFIDSSQFQKGYGSRNTHPHSHILSYCFRGELSYICLEDNESFKVPEFAPVIESPLLKPYCVHKVVGACHGLLCLKGFHQGYRKLMLVIRNPSIPKSLGIAAPRSYYQTRNDYGFGVCPVTKDPTVVTIQRGVGMTWHVEVFTFSSGVWNVIPSGNLPHKSIHLNSRTHVFIDRFIYWSAFYKYTTNPMVLSFDLIAKEFKVVDLPQELRNKLVDGRPVALANLRESLVVYEIPVDGVECFDVWVMERDSSFRNYSQLVNVYVKS